MGKIGGSESERMRFYHRGRTGRDGTQGQRADDRRESRARHEMEVKTKHQDLASRRSPEILGLDIDT